MNPPVVSRPAPRGAHLVAVLVTLGEALVLLGFVAFYVYEIAVGASDTITSAAMSAVLILVFAILLLVLAAAWRRAADWARTPTLLWNALLLPVAWSLHESDRTPVAVGVAVLAIVGIAAALASPPRDAATDSGSDSGNEPGNDAARDLS